MTIKNFEPLQPTIRQERDLIAHIVNSLGYWPRESVVFALIQEDKAGPLLRMDIKLEAPEAAQELANLLEHYTQQLTAYDEAQQLFIFFFGNSQHPRKNPLTVDIQLLAIDEEESQQVRPFMQEIHRWAQKQSKSIMDSLYIGNASYWGVLYPEAKHVLVGANQEILDSPIYAFNISQGITVNDNQLELIACKEWNPEVRDTESKLWHQEMQGWYEIYQREFASKRSGNPQDHWQQVRAQLEFWNIALEITKKLSQKSLAGAPADRGKQQSPLAQDLRAELPAQIAGYIFGAIQDLTFIHHLLFLACCGYSRSLTASQSFEALALELESHGEPSNFLMENISCIVPLGSKNKDLEETCLRLLEPKESAQISWQEAQEDLDFVAKTLSGSGGTSINWATVEALEVLCFLGRDTIKNQAKYNLLTLLAWLNWLKGKSSEANHYYQQAQIEMHEDTAVLQAALESNTLPEVAFDPKLSWAAYKNKS